MPAVLVRSDSIRRDYGLTYSGSWWVWVLRRVSGGAALEGRQALGNWWGNARGSPQEHGQFVEFNAIVTICNRLADRKIVLLQQYRLYRT